MRIHWGKGPEGRLTLPGWRLSSPVLCEGCGPSEASGTGYSLLHPTPCLLQTGDTSADNSKVSPGSSKHPESCKAEKLGQNKPKTRASPK